MLEDFEQEVVALNASEDAEASTSPMKGRDRRPAAKETIGKGSAVEALNRPKPA